MRRGRRPKRGRGSTDGRAPAAAAAAALPIALPSGAERGRPRTARARSGPAARAQRGAADMHRTGLLFPGQQGRM